MNDVNSVIILYSLRFGSLSHTTRRGRATWQGLPFWYAVDLVIFACLNFREFGNLEFGTSASFKF